MYTLYTYSLAYEVHNLWIYVKFRSLLDSFIYSTGSYPKSWIQSCTSQKSHSIRLEEVGGAEYILSFFLSSSFGSKDSDKSHPNWIVEATNKVHVVLIISTSWKAAVFPLMMFQRQRSLLEPDGARMHCNVSFVHWFTPFLLVLVNIKDFHEIQQKSQCPSSSDLLSLLLHCFHHFHHFHPSNLQWQFGLVLKSVGRPFIKKGQLILLSISSLVQSTLFTFNLFEGFMPCMYFHNPS